MLLHHPHSKLSRYIPDQYTQTYPILYQHARARTHTHTHKKRTLRGWQLYNQFHQLLSLSSFLLIIVLDPTSLHTSSHSLFFSLLTRTPFSTWFGNSNNLFSALPNFLSLPPISNSTTITDIQLRLLSLSSLFSLAMAFFQAITLYVQPCDSHHEFNFLLFLSPFTPLLHSLSLSLSLYFKSKI